MNATETADPNFWLEVVRQRVNEIRFGRIDIVVHEGRVTQVEVTEKTRLPVTPSESSRFKPPGPQG